MKNFIPAAALLLLACRVLAAPPAGYYLVWQDEFDGASLDSSKWIHWLTGPRRDAVNTSAAVAVGGGNLTITTYTSAGTHYTGMIATQNKLQPVYGYLEASINYDSSPGMWSAFWLQSPTMGGYIGDPANGGAEVDISEHRSTDGTSDISGQYQSNVHWDGYGADHKSDNAPGNYGSGFGTGFHTNGFKWTDGNYSFSVDGTQYKSTGNGNSDRSEFIILSSEVEDGSWAGSIPGGGYGDLATSTTKMIVDYVRYYAPTSQVFWLGNSSLLWNNSANWLSNRVPATADEVVFSWLTPLASSSTTLDADLNVNKVTFIDKTGYTVNGSTYSPVTTSVDDFSVAGLGDYTSTRILDNGALETNVAFSDGTGGLAASYGGAVAQAEQVVLLRDDFDLAVGETLLVDVSMAADADQMDFGLAVSATKTPTSASVGDTDTRDLFDWAAVYVRPSQNAVRATSSINGVVDTGTGVLGADETAVSQLFIERNSSTQFTLGYYDTNGVRFQSRTVTFTNTNVGTAIGFYADLRAVGGNLAALDNLRTSTGDGTNTLTIGGGGVFATTEGGTVTINAAVSLGASQPWNVAGGRTVHQAGRLNAAVGSTLSKTGIGTLILSATNNSWSSGTLVSGGTLQIGDGGATGSLGSGPVTNNATLTFNTTSSLAVSHVISGSGALNQIAAGTVTLSGNNSYTNVTTIGSGQGPGVLRLAHNNALGTTAGETIIGPAGNASPARLELSNNVSSPEPLTLAGRSPGNSAAAIANVSGSNTLSGAITFTFGGTWYNYRTDAGKLTLAGAINSGATTGGRTNNLYGAGTGEISGVIGGGSATMAVAKFDSGTWILSGANTYTGPTTINAGTLLVNGVAGPDAVTVAGGTLGGTGTITGPVSVQSGAKLSPGASAGRLTVSNSVTLLSGSTTLLEISQSPLTNDQLRVIGTLSYGGTLTVTNLGGTLTVGDAFPLFSAASFSGSFTATNLPPLGTGLAWNFTGTNGVLSVVPGVATNPTNVTASVSGGSLTLSWPADHTGWQLQTQTNPLAVGLATNWFAVPNSALTNQMVFPVGVENGSVFFRLAYP